MGFGDVYGICGNTASHCAGDHADCGVLFRKEIPSRLQVFGAVLSVIGVAVISLAQQRGSNEAGGVAFLFCAVVSSVGYNLLMRDTADSFTSFERPM